MLVIVCALLIGLLTLHGGKRTAFGDEIAAQALGYRKFLRRVTQSQLQSRLAQDSQYFYRIIPYAEAMGLGGRLARTLGDTALEPCDWYQDACTSAIPTKVFAFCLALRSVCAILTVTKKLLQKSCNELWYKADGVWPILLYTKDIWACGSKGYDAQVGTSGFAFLTAKGEVCNAGVAILEDKVI